MMMMKRMTALASLVLTGVVACAGASGGEDLATEQAANCGSGTRFYVPPADPGALTQIKDLKKQHDKADAKRIEEMIETPQAVWLTQGTPSDVKKQVKGVMKDAGRSVPVLVAYNIPFRDCAQFSAGGATTKQAYFDWIDAVAQGIGSGNAVVILEPDSLGIIPWYNPFASRETWLPPEERDTLEWCQPAEADPATAASDRFEMLNYAVASLKANAKTKVYLDGTHTGWLGSGDTADRLLQAGVKDADGFFLNVSNFQVDERLEKYGTWVAKCIWFADPSSGSWGAGHTEWCGSQYSPASPDDFSTWGLTDQWYADNVESQTWVPYPGDAGLKHFVIDSSRNGQGPWVATDEQKALGDVQDWCNPPQRGLGQPPTSVTGNTLIDAFLWIKTPGQSDGQCNRWSPAGSQDPVRMIMDPAAGAWFPDLALELSTNANPAL